MRTWILCVLGLLLCPVAGWAQENVTETPGTSWRAEVREDLETLKSSRQEIKENSREGREEESRLREQIREATRSGDQEKAKQLREQLRSMHRDNVSQMQQDKSALKDAHEDLRENKPPRRGGEKLPRYTPPAQGRGSAGRGGRH